MSNLSDKQLNSESESQTDVTSTEGEATVKRRAPIGEKILNILLVISVLIFVCVIVVKGFLFCTVTVQQTSMTPTLADGQTVSVSKVRPLERGNIVVFYKDDVANKFFAAFGNKDKKLVKRVVAVGGDKLWAELQSDGTYAFRVKTPQGDVLDETGYTFDGKSVEIPNVVADRLGKMSDHVGYDNALVIDEGYFFAMGDNRNGSEDSRGELWQVPYTRLFGTVI
ncbi:MAG: signal peptidase I [Corallococcus sp.]|nr:signal peptidase I [Corallococcus sp.]